MTRTTANCSELHQALAAVSSIESEVVQMRLDRVRTYYELLNMPFEVNYLILLISISTLFLYLLSFPQIIMFR